MAPDADGQGGGLSLRMLGPLTVERSGEPVPLGGRQQRAVLAFLLTRGGTPAGVSVLADALWGERAPVGSAQTVQTYVSHLRDALEPGRDKTARSRYIRTERNGYRLVLDGDRVDAVEFEARVAHGLSFLERADFEAGKAALTAGLGLWRGEVLADLADYGFVPAVAARYAELRAAATEALIDARLGLGEHQSLIPELDALIAVDPLRERLHGQRMLALYRAGRQSDALAGYRRLHALLDEELGIEPGRPIQQLHASILTQDPALDWHPPGPVREAAATGAPPARRRRRVVWATAITALLVAVTITTMVVRTAARSTLAALPENGIGVLHRDGTMTDGLRTGLVPEAIAYGAGSLWVANRADKTVVRVDPRHHRIVQTIPVPGAPTALTVTGRDVWVAIFTADSVSRINADNNQVVRTIPVGSRPAAIVGDEAGVWVANSGDSTIQRVDPVTGYPDPVIEVGNGPDGLALDGRTIWVANAGDNTVTHLDTTTGREASAGVRVGSGPRGILVAGGEVWVANSLSKSVSRIDPVTDNVTTVPVGDGPAALAATTSTIWVANEFDGTVARIDARTGLPRGRPFSVGASPLAMTSAADKLWVAAGAFAGSSHVGGTLTIVTPLMPGDIEGIDPSGVYLIDTIEAERLVYDGLVALRNVGALSGSTLVPDLAEAIPAPTDNGLTYTFTLRKGIRYSDGTTVKASDFVLGLHRALIAKYGNPSYYWKVKGAENCTKQPKRCDLAQGITYDDSVGVVTFHLTEPDPDLPYKLAYFVFPMPPGTPLTEARTPIPGTGPYKIEGYRERGSVRGRAALKLTKGYRKAAGFDLVRNTYFAQWSYAAQQRGFVDRIHYQRNKIATGEKLVEQDSADLVQLTATPGDTLPRGLLDSVHDRFPTRLDVQEEPTTDWVVLNTRLPPFDKPKARQAVNYAVDRLRWVRRYGDKLVTSVPTCQILPRNFPGYRPYCPYTFNPGNGEYHGPDLAKARRLVKESRTKGMHVTVQGFADPSSHVTTLFLKSVLAHIGYNADIREYDPKPENVAHFRTAQVSQNGWGADFPLPSNFYYNGHDCASTAAGGLGSATACDPALDALAKKAVALEASNPSGAIRLWTRIDHELVDLSFVVPLSNDVVPTLVSKRVGNYQSSQFNGPVLTQIWVK
jgi:YVTN family beta-propeller protein